MTFKDLQKLVQSHSDTEQNKLIGLAKKDYKEKLTIKKTARHLRAL
jgi:hypothetical protein